MCVGLFQVMTFTRANSARAQTPACMGLTRGDRLKTRGNTRTALWSAATCRRFVRLADLSAKQRRVERRGKASEPIVRSRIVRLTTFDGDKSPAESADESPHSKGFAVSRAAPILEPALTQIMEG